MESDCRQRQIEINAPTTDMGQMIEKEFMKGEMGYAWKLQNMPKYLIEDMDNLIEEADKDAAKEKGEEIETPEESLDSEDTCP